MNEHLTSPETEKKVEALVAELAAQDAVGKRAAAAALPGPLADAFALAQGIPVGPWTVRAFCDIDFEFLAALDHPLSRMYADALLGADTAASFLPTGLPVWQAAWVLTRDPDETEAMLSKPGGKGELSKLARKEFGKLPTKALAAFFVAIMKQVELSSSTAVKYEEAAEEKEGEEVKVAENPT